MIAALADEGFGVHPVATGESALAVLASRDVACVVLGARPPLGAAIDTLRRLHAGHPSIPIVVTAEAASVDFAICAIKAGGADVVEPTSDVGGRVRGAVADARGAAGARRRRLLRAAFVGRET